MLIVFCILVVLAAVVLGFIVLIQNPKGGGLSSSLGGIGNQLMGVKQTTDVLEKGTWVFAGVVGILCLLSPLFIPKTVAGGDTDLMDKAPINQSSGAQPKAPATNTAPMPGTTPPAADTPK